MSKTYDILMEPRSWAKFWQLTNMVSTEIAAFGYCEFEKDGDDAYLYVSELFTPPQEVSTTEVDFVTKGLPYAVNKATKEGKLDQLRFCIHSHGNMSVGFSATDEEMIRTFGEQGIPWLASAIFNKKGESNARLDVFKVDQIPGVGQVTIDASIYRESDLDLINECKQEIDEFVTKQTYSYSSQHKKKKKGSDAGQSKQSESHLPQFHDTYTQDWEYFDATTVEDAYDLFEKAYDSNWEFCRDDAGAIYLFDPQDGGYSEYMGSIPAELSEIVAAPEYWLTPAEEGSLVTVEAVEAKLDGEEERVSGEVVA
jgi:hypothetical protein